MHGDGKKNDENADNSLLNSHITPEVIYSISTPSRKARIHINRQYCLKKCFFNDAVTFSVNAAEFHKKGRFFCDS
jgi:hypothetical protein